MLLVQLAALLGGLESMLGARRVLDVVCCFMTLRCSSSGLQRPYGEVLVQPGESTVYLGAGNPMCPETLCCPLIFLASRCPRVWSFVVVCVVKE